MNSRLLNCYNYNKNVFNSVKMTALKYKCFLKSRKHLRLLLNRCNSRFNDKTFDIVQLFRGAEIDCTKYNSPKLMAKQITKNFGQRMTVAKLKT